MKNTIIIDSLWEQREALYTQSFDLLRKLMNTEYNSTMDQVDDMVKVGNLANAIKSIDAARSAISKNRE